MSSRSDDYGHVPDIWDTIERIEEIAGRLWNDDYSVKTLRWTDGDYTVEAFHNSTDRPGFREVLVYDADRGWGITLSILQSIREDEPDLIPGDTADVYMITVDPVMLIDQEQATEVYDRCIGNLYEELTTR